MNEKRPDGIDQRGYPRMSALILSDEQSKFVSGVEQEIREIEANLPRTEGKFLDVYRKSIENIRKAKDALTPYEQQREKIFDAAPELKRYLDLMNKDVISGLNQEELIEQREIWNGLNDSERRAWVTVLDLFAQDRHLRAAYTRWTEHLKVLKLTAARNNFTLPTDKTPAEKPSLVTVPACYSQHAGFSHTSDFRSVTLRGQRFTLTANQATVINVLHDAHMDGNPEVGQARILEEELNSTGARLRDTFKRNQQAWKVLIVKGERRGTFRLNLDPPTA